MKKVLIGTVGLLMLASAILGYFQWREHHLSGNFKHILEVMFDRSNTEADVRGYLHDARLAASTGVDKKALAEMESMLVLRKQANGEREEAGEIFAENMKSFFRYQRELTERLSRSVVNLPDREFNREMDARKKLTDESKAESESNYHRMDELKKQAEEKERKANELEKALRLQLSLPQRKLTTS